MAWERLPVGKEKRSGRNFESGTPFATFEANSYHMKKLLIAALFVAGNAFAAQAQTTEAKPKAKKAAVTEETAVKAPEAKSCCASKATAEAKSCSESKTAETTAAPATQTANAPAAKPACCASKSASSCGSKGSSTAQATEPEKKEEKK
jgi:hypothetical protein